MFNCPANLASHRRWHKPRQSSTSQKNVAPGNLKLKNKSNIRPNENTGGDGQVGNFACKDCGKIFRRYLRMQTFYFRKVYEIYFMVLEWLT